MVRGKIELQRIGNAARRQMTFTKRLNSLLKKAYDLSSVRCDAEVAVIVFSDRSKLYKFSSASLEITIDRYKMQKDVSDEIGIEKNLQEKIVQLKDKMRVLVEKDEKLLQEYHVEPQLQVTAIRDMDPTNQADPQSMEIETELIIVRPPTRVPEA